MLFCGVLACRRDAFRFCSEKGFVLSYSVEHPWRIYSKTRRMQYYFKGFEVKVLFYGEC